VADIFQEIATTGDIEGVSILGGEPLQQRRGVLALLQLIKTTRLSVLLFSGFSLEEIRRMPEADQLFSLVDVLIAGRYDDTKRLARGLQGSTNKTV
jgi:anaerobic ribonucleoside-triphosphate reductase activating protein